MKVLKPGRLHDVPTFKTTCGTCDAELEVEIGDMAKRWMGTARDGKLIYFCTCPECAFMVEMKVPVEYRKLVRSV